MTEQLNLNKALERCAVHAAEHGLKAPERLTNEDGTPSDEAARFRNESGLTYDWMYTGEGRKYQPGHEQ